MEKRDRLLALREAFVTHYKPGHFSMSTFIHVPAHVGLVDNVTPTLLNHCGTTCCVLGYGALSPALQREGLQFIRSSWVWGGVGLVISAPGGVATPESLQDYPPTLARIRVFFGISQSAVEALFYSDIHPEHDEKAIVLKRLDAVIANPYAAFDTDLPDHDASFDNETWDEFHLNTFNYNCPDAYEDLRDNLRRLGRL